MGKRAANAILSPDIPAFVSSLIALIFQRQALVRVDSSKKSKHCYLAGS